MIWPHAATDPEFVVDDSIKLSHMILISAPNWPQSNRLRTRREKQLAVIDACVWHLGEMLPEWMYDGYSHRSGRHPNEPLVHHHIAFL
ncbi:hypothetical protein VNO77_19705 [Canavalia gladiata]|uniref:Uncharacterized protein n=1 Tax=Canavalia gladiata TaxID=3824 RepID=A0AAN9QKR5_CANGL